MSTELFLNTNCRLSKQQQFKIYYRWRKQIVDKIYNLYVLAGDVRLEEILEERIE